MFATSESIARRGEADMNQLLWMDIQQGSFGPDGDLYSRKGLGMTLLALPFVWLGMVWSRLGLVHFALLLNPVLTAATGALIYRAGVRLGWQRATAVASALLFGLATLAWPYTQEFFSDPVCAFGLFAAFYGLLSFGQSGNKRYLVLGGAAWGIAYLARSVNLATLPIFLVGLYVVLDMRVRLYRRTNRSAATNTWRSVFKYQWRPMVSFLVPVVIAGLLSLWWNWARYGSIWETGYVASESFSAPWLFGLYGLIAGPARGFFWYSPILLLAIPGGVWFWRHARRTLLIVLALTLLYFLLYAKWYMWHGGSSWGPRFLVPVVPFLALLCGPAWERLVLRRRWGWLGAGLGALLALLSVAVQWLGMVIPFSLVQDWLAAQVQPLYAPETFTQLRYSPLLLQWNFLAPENILFVWWRNAAGWAAIDWPALALPLSAVVMGAILLLRRSRWQADSAAIDPPRNLLYFVALLVIAVAILTYQYRTAAATEIARIAGRISAEERRGDAILHLAPQETQELANAYHGRLGTWGLRAQADKPQVETILLRLQEQGIERLWTVPDATPPESSPWETALRAEHYLLWETRPAGQDGRRLALYALAGGQDLGEVGLGTIFGNPALAETVNQTIDETNGWFRLAGYRLTQQTTPGGEILLALRWESLHPVEYNYQVFVHLLDGAGEKVAQRDGMPVQWLRPTSTWLPGEQITDRYGFALPQNLPPGDYTIVVGLYDPVTGQRLPVSAGPGDYAIELGPVSVQP